MRYRYTNVKNAEYRQHEMLRRLWSHRNSNSLMMKMQNGIAALEDSLKILTKLNTLLPHHSVIMLLGIFPHDVKTYVHTDVYSKFIHNCPKLEATKMSFRGYQTNKMWYIQTMEYYSVLKEMNIQTIKRTEETNAYGLYDTSMQFWQKEIEVWT